MIDLKSVGLLEIVKTYQKRMIFYFPKKDDWMDESLRNELWQILCENTKIGSKINLYANNHTVGAWIIDHKAEHSLFIRDPNLLLECKLSHYALTWISQI